MWLLHGSQLTQTLSVMRGPTLFVLWCGGEGVAVEALMTFVLNTMPPEQVAYEFRTTQFILSFRKC